MEERLKVEVQISRMMQKGCNVLLQSRYRSIGRRNPVLRKCSKRLRALWLREYHARQNCSLH